MSQIWPESDRKPSEPLDMAKVSFQSSHFELCSASESDRYGKHQPTGALLDVKSLGQILPKSGKQTQTNIYTHEYINKQKDKDKLDRERHT